MPTPLAGQVALSGTAQPLSTPRSVVAFSLKAPASNTAPAFIGPLGVTLSTGYQLDPGETFEYEARSQNGQAFYQVGLGDLYVVGSTGDVVTWFASP